MDEYGITQLDNTGYDAPVPNQFWSTGSDMLMVLLPGAGYTNQMPLMFYTHELAIQRGWDILEVNYDYSMLPNDTSKEELLQRLTQDVRSALDAALAEGDYRAVVLAGKSLGTIAMMTLLQGGIVQDVTTLWLTPIIRWPEVREVMRATATQSAVVIGTRDDHYDSGFLTEIESKGAMVEIVEGGDHSLDIEGDVVASIGTLRQVIRALDGFLVR